MKTGIRLDLSIPPDWTRIELVRKAVGFCVWAVFGRGDLRDSLSMVSAELLENAVKYSAPDREVRLLITEEPDRLVVAVTNDVEGDAHVTALTQRLEWLKTFSSPADAYMAALSEVFDHKGEERAGEGGLGIVRIAYEGGCNLECDTSKPDQVTVRASRALPVETPIA